MAIKEPKTISRRGEKRKKELGDRSYAVAKACIFGGVGLLFLAILSFLAMQWGAGIVFVASAVVCYFPYKHIYRYPPTAYELLEDGIKVYQIDTEEVFIPYSKVKRVTVFNPEIKQNFLFTTRRSVFITLKQETEDEENMQVVRIFFPYEADAVYFQILKAKLDYDGIPADR